MIAGAPSPQLWRNTRFALTVQSTVALQCASLGIPVFLCSWLRDSSSGYVEQFSRFGIGHILESSDELSEIPRLLEVKGQDRSNATCLVGNHGSCETAGSALANRFIFRSDKSLAYPHICQEPCPPRKFRWLNRSWSFSPGPGRRRAFASRWGTFRATRLYSLQARFLPRPPVTFSRFISPGFWERRPSASMPWA